MGMEVGSGMCESGVERQGSGVGATRIFEVLRPAVVLREGIGPIWILEWS
jgi:hypothetical protein